MTVRVHLLGYLTRYSPSGQEKFKLDLAPEATVGTLLEKIGFPAGIERMILVNGRQAGPTAGLGEDDEVFIFSPATGG
jgi:molybdopterin converting factor small subunit